MARGWDWCMPPGTHALTLPPPLCWLQCQCIGRTWNHVLKMAEAAPNDHTPPTNTTTTWKPILLLIFFIWFGISGYISAWELYYCGCCRFCFFFSYELRLCDSFLSHQSFTGPLVPSTLWWLQNLPHSVSRDIPEQVSISIHDLLQVLDEGLSLFSPLSWVCAFLLTVAPENYLRQLFFTFFS